MQLPPDFTIDSLSSLRRWFMTQPDHKPEHLEMTEAQYNRYKELVYLSDPISRFMGTKITLTPLSPEGSGQ